MKTGALAWNVVGTDIDDNRARLEPSPLNELSFTDGRYDDIGLFDLHMLHR